MVERPLTRFGVAFQSPNPTCKSIVEFFARKHKGRVLSSNMNLASKALNVKVAQTQISRSKPKREGHDQDSNAKVMYRMRRSYLQTKRKGRVSAPKCEPRVSTTDAKLTPSI